MPVYEYENAICGCQQSKVLTARQYEAIREIPVICQHGSLLHRVFSFSFGRIESTFDTHLSTATGEVVHSKREFHDQLKAKSAADSERLGMHVDLQPVAVQDLAHTVKGDGLASSYAEKKRVDHSSRWTKVDTIPGV